MRREGIWGNRGGDLGPVPAVCREDAVRQRGIHGLETCKEKGVRTAGALPKEQGNAGGRAA